MSRRPLLLALLPLACACAEPGVRSRSRSVDLPVLSVDATPALEIGVLEGDERYTFQNVTSVTPLSSGALVVADAGAAELLRYAADGTFERRWGGRGGGPGEFGQLARVYAWTGDSVAALDQQSERLSVFDAVGAFARQVGAREVSGDSLFAMDVWLYGRFWVDGAVGREARSAVRAALDRLPRPVAAPGYRYVRVASDGRLWVREAHASEAGTTAWTVLDASGAPVAAAVLPDRLDPQYLGAGRVIGRWRGESDVNFVRAYELRETGATSAAPAWLTSPESRPDVPAPEEAEFLAMIRNAIKQMASAQEIHYATHYSYTSEIDSLTWEAPEGLVVDFVDAGTRGWTAVFTHPGFDRICGLSYGFDVPAGWRPGAIVCGPAAAHASES